MIITVTLYFNPNLKSKINKKEILYWINTRELNRVPSIKYLSYIYIY